MRFRGRVQAIDRVGRERDRGVEAEAIRRPDNVVVDRLGHTDDRDSAMTELMRNCKGAVAADYDQRAESHFVEHVDAAVGIVVDAFRRRHRVRERVAAVRGAENRPTEPENAGDVARGEDARSPGLDQAIETVFETNDFNSAVGRGLDDGADDGVESRRVAAAGEDTQSSHCWHWIECSSTW